MYAVIPCQGCHANIIVSKTLNISLGVLMGEKETLTSPTIRYRNSTRIHTLTVFIDVTQIDTYGSPRESPQSRTRI